MNKFKTLLLALPLLAVSTTANAIQDDKVKHLGVSTVISSSTMLLTDDWKTSLTLCMGVGLGKEIYDEIDYGGFSKSDLAYDLAGCVAGSFIGKTGLYLFADDDYKGIGWKVEF